MREHAHSPSAPTQRSGSGRTDVAGDMLVTFGSAALLLVLNVPTIRFLVDALQPEGYGQFQLARRAAFYGFPILLIGLNTALVRSLSLNELDRQRCRDLVLGGFLVVVAGMITVAAMGWLLADPFGRLLFGRVIEGASEALATFLAAALAYGFVYALLRGGGRLAASNVYLVVLMGVIPLLASLGAEGTDPFVLLQGVAVAMLVVTLPTGIWAYRAIVGRSVGSIPVRARLDPSGTTAHGQLKGIRCGIADLVGYGARRMFVPLFVGANALLGPAALNHAGKGEVAGQLLIALAIGRALEQVVGPVSIVMLPRLSVMVGRDQHAQLQRYGELLVHGFTGALVFAVLQAVVFSAVIVAAWFGSERLALIPVVDVVLLAAAPMILYSLTQTLVDALTDAAWCWLRRAWVWLRTRA